MNVRTLRGPRVVTATMAQGRALLVQTLRLARSKPAWAAAALFVSILALELLYPNDRALLAAVRCFRDDPEFIAQAVAYQLGQWGDFPTYNLPVALMIWFYGVAAKRRAWRRIALVALLGATLAGIFDDFFRLTLGRPRPDSYPYAPDGFYGPAKALLGRYQSFPSGHSASDMGMAVGLLAVNRWLGVVALLFGLAVIWARMELNKHYPSDVVVGAIIGIYFGVLVGAAAGRINRA